MCPYLCFVFDPLKDLVNLLSTVGIDFDDEAFPILGFESRSGRERGSNKDHRVPNLEKSKVSTPMVLNSLEFLAGDIVGKSFREEQNYIPDAQEETHGYKERDAQETTITIVSI